MGRKVGGKRLGFFGKVLSFLLVIGILANIQDVRRYIRIRRM